MNGSRVLVTGATGFIGGRLVERLLLEGAATVRALTSSYGKCARIARFPVELQRGDLLDRQQVVAAAEGCDVIFHCAYGSRGTPEERRRVNVEGTGNVISAAAATGARLVHLSTQMVYGVPERGVIDEDSPRSRSGSTYGDSKLQAEERVLEAAADGLAATVLQPTAVYGPFAPVWTVGVLTKMRGGKVPLVDGGQGVCNAVYVDDVIDAMLLAAQRDAAVGESFLVSAAQPTTWREFYGHYEAMLGVPATVPVAATDAAVQRRRTLLLELPAILRQEPAVRNRLRATVEGQMLARVLRRLRRRPPPATATPELDRLQRLREPQEPEVPSLAPSDAAFFASRARVSIEKARRLLGFEPAFTLGAGMDLTGEWARWAGLVPEAPTLPAEAA